MQDTEQVITIYTDGASRGNPGNSAWAYLILGTGGQDLSKQAGYIGKATNNQVEYFAVIRALQKTIEITDRRIKHFSDSQLIVNQLNGNWKVKNRELSRLFRRVRKLEKHFTSVSHTHVPRSHKFLSQVDRLCNNRLDEIEK